MLATFHHATVHDGLVIRNHGDERGNGVFATRPLPEGTLIFSEYPILGMQLGTQQTALHARARLGLLESFGGSLQPCEDLGVVLRADALRRGASRSRAVIRARCGRHGRRARQGGWIRRVSLGKPPPPLQGAAGGARALER